MSACARVCMWARKWVWVSVGACACVLARVCACVGACVVWYICVGTSVWVCV